jgi:hypothetical protein
VEVRGGERIMANHYIRQDIERRMILFGWSEREIVDFINDTLERELMLRTGDTK